MFRKLIGAFVGLAMMGMAGTANAVPITYKFSGERLDTTPFSGTFTYESIQPDQAPPSDGTGAYDFTELVYLEGAQTLVFQDLGGADGIFIDNSTPYEIQVIASTGQGNILNGLELFDMSITFSVSPNLFNTDALFGPDLTIGDFTLAELDANSFGGLFQGNITTLSAPEPSTLALFATGLALLAFLGWRRSRQKAHAAA